jgi:hypothetical protein
MDLFLVICEDRVIERYTALAAARKFVEDKTGGVYVSHTYQIAQVLMTNKAVRIWNEP